MKIGGNEIFDNRGRKYLLRKTSPKDSEGLHDFYRKLSKRSKYLFHPHPFDKTLLRALLSNRKDVRTVLLNNREKVVGYAFLSHIPMYAGIGYFGIGLADEYQGAGLGSGCMKQLFKIALGDGYKKVILNVYSDNVRAVRLYEKLGFKKFKIWPVLRYTIVINEILRSGELLKFVGKSFESAFLTSKEKRESLWLFKKI